MAYDPYASLNTPDQMAQRLASLVKPSTGGQTLPTGQGGMENMPRVTTGPGPNYSAPTGPKPAASINDAAPWMGGGWADYAKPGSAQQALYDAFNSGLTGEDAVQYAAKNGAPGIAYYADKNQYGLPNGYYVAPNPSDSSKLDLIQRASGGGGLASLSPLLSFLGSGIGTGMPSTPVGIGGGMWSGAADQAVQKLNAQGSDKLAALLQMLMGGGGSVASQIAGGGHTGHTS